MPKVRRQDLPLALLNHLLDRISERAISADQLEEFVDWLDTEPEVPDGGSNGSPECVSAVKASS